MSAATVATVTPGAFLTLHYRLKGPDGQILVDTFAQQPATLTLGQGELAPGLEARLIGLPEGAHEHFQLAADEGFGPRKAELMQPVSRRLLAEQGDPDQDYQIGDVVQFPAPQGGAQFAGTVAAQHEDHLLFDFNHPLAGVALSFEVQVIGVL
ncbi:MAG: FKBP-type peptidyl-prolyl cis-trans isomerase [Inhella sp.]